ncbi:hypothetical protein CVU82_00880 [Candidatus Falkowbacteria bacterium HGW-Falkowbacteria-1]|uniref:Solute-binding protein family 3/N-terminal domain-containing protein n=1 Tax=Candidatus Falkowbacteria bacterium HGW-Falkowbacteria-1 TaxID=2013768 RepID=A0A2N2EAJ4_9BACT|nr:MAG: hypothetical protein CVU82_00880 [Candidatus Falkowbacteria bacterium HGW-Falkowbacteria-1]
MRYMEKKKIFFVILLIIIVVATTMFLLWRRNLDADNSLSNVKKRGVLVVGGDAPYGVMEFFNEDNEIDGIDVDIAREIASRLGVRLEFNDYDWDQLFLKVKNDEIDLAASSITITPERQKEMLFSTSYFNGGQVIVVRSGNQDIGGVNDLVGIKIAVQEGTTGYDEAKKYTQENLIFPYLNFDDSGIINDLENEKFEAIIVDYVQALSMIKVYSGLKIVGTPFTREDYGLVTKIGNNTLMQEINSIILNMEKEGTLKKIEIKWSAF